MRLILATESFFLMSLEGLLPGSSVKEYGYMDVESIKLTQGQERRIHIKCYKKDNPKQKELLLGSEDQESFFKVLHVLQRQVPI